jgi:dTDP-4-amino-4,6-dideoxygalactose transaminase
MYQNDGTNLPIASDLAARGINLPSWHGLPAADLKDIATVVRDFRWSTS